jgi:hypothetical protein
MTSKKSASSFECGNCGQAEAKIGDMNVCGRCRRVRYCSRDCQAAHWKRGGHKKLCIPPEACKPSAQPLEDRSAEIQCLICLGTEGRVYTHACRTRIHISCLADLFGHHTCGNSLCSKSCNVQPPCPVCRVPLPKLCEIFDDLVRLEQFQECKELSSRVNDPSETINWIMFHEARYHFNLQNWEKAIELFKTFMKNASSSWGGRHMKMVGEARSYLTDAEIYLRTTKR